MALTQARGFAAHTGRRYGDFTRGRPVDVLTQPSAFGAHTHGRYGSFVNKTPSTPPERRILTQLRTFGAHTGQRYGSFANKTPFIPPAPTAPIGGRRIQLPFALIDELRFQRLDEDDLLLIIAAQIASNSIH